MDQYEQIQSYNKKFFQGVVVKLLLALLALFGVAAVIGLNWYYRDLEERKISFEEAKRIGNWELVDDYYVFQGAFKLNMFGDSAKNVEILDEKNGNEINILAMSKDFSSLHLKYDPNRSEDEKSNDELFMDFYSADSYAVRGTGKIEDGRAEIYYNMIENKGYENLNDKISGFLGKIDCKDSVMVILITNKAAQFNKERALDFAKKMSCGDSVSEKNAEGKSENIPSENANNPNNPITSIDAGVEDIGNISSIDAEVPEEAPREEPSLPAEENALGSQDNDGDGLSNNVEFVISSDPNKVDTDSDGFNDFDEIKFGYNPQIPSPGDELPSNYYSKIKEQIRIIDEENYKKIFLQ